MAATDGPFIQQV